MNTAAQAIVNQSNAQTPPPETPKVEGAEPVAAAPEATKEEVLSPKLAIIANKERALVKKQQEFQKQMEDWRKEKEALTKELETFRSKQSKWKEDPDSALQELGWDYEKLTERKLNGGQPSAQEIEKKVEERFKSFEQRMEEEKAAMAKKAEEEKAIKEKEIIDGFKRELKSYGTSQKDKFKLCSILDPEAELVYETIDTYYQTHGKVLNNEEAYHLVEKYFNKLYEDVTKVMTPKEKQELEAEKKALGVADKKPSTTTLTNNLSSTASFLPPKTEEDRIKRALAALDGQKA